MPGQVQAQGILLAAQALAVAPILVFFDHEHRRWRRRTRFTTKQVVLTGCLVGVVLLGSRQRLGQRCQQAGPVRPQCVQGAGSNQRFQGSTIGFLAIDATTKIGQVGKCSASLARIQHTLDSPLADAFDGPQAVTDGCGIGNGKYVVRGIHVRRQHLDVQAATLVDHGHHLFGVLHVGSEHRTHEGRRVVRLEVSRLIGE